MAAQRGVPSYQIKLVVAGQSTPLARPFDKLEASQGQQELLTIASKGHVLGEGRPLETTVADVSFEHLPVDCFLGPKKGEVAVEMVERKEMSITARGRDDKLDGPRGVLFDQLDSQAAPHLVEGSCYGSCSKEAVCHGYWCWHCSCGCLERSRT